MLKQHWEVLQSTIKRKLHYLSDDEVGRDSLKLFSEAAFGMTQLCEDPIFADLSETSLHKLVRSLCLGGEAKDLTRLIHSELKDLCSANARRFASSVREDCWTVNPLQSNRSVLEASAIHWLWFLCSVKFVERVFVYLDSCYLAPWGEKEVRNVCMSEFKQELECHLGGTVAQVLTKRLISEFNAIRDLEWTPVTASPDDEAKTELVLSNLPALLETRKDLIAIMDCLHRLDYVKTVFDPEYLKSIEMALTPEFNCLWLDDGNTVGPSICVLSTMKRLLFEYSRAQLFMKTEMVTQVALQTLSSCLQKHVSEIFKNKCVIFHEFYETNKFHYIVFIIRSFGLLGLGDLARVAWIDFVNDKIKDTMEKCMIEVPNSRAISSLLLVIRRIDSMARKLGMALPSSGGSSSPSAQQYSTLKSQYVSGEVCGVSDLYGCATPLELKAFEILEKLSHQLLSQRSPLYSSASILSTMNSSDAIVKQATDRMALVLNSIPNSSVWLSKALNLFLDHLLRGRDANLIKFISKQKEESLSIGKLNATSSSSRSILNSIEPLLKESLRLFKLIDAKDMFVSLFEKSFARRFCLGDSHYEGIEKMFIMLLAEECGHSFAAKVNEIVSETLASRELADRFNESSDFKSLIQSDNNESVFTKDDSCITVSVVSSSLWQRISQVTDTNGKKIRQRFDYINVILPTQLDQVLQAYEAFYSAEKQSKYLTWILQDSGCILSAHFPGSQDNKYRTYFIEASAIQGIILLMFNTSDTISFQTLVTKTNFQPSVLRQELGILCLDTERRILTQHGEPNNIMFSVNSAFCYSKKHIRLKSLNPDSDVEPAREEYESQLVDMERKRASLLDAFIVRCVKLKLANTDEELTAAMMQNSRLRICSEEFLKERIGVMVEKDLIAKCEEVPGRYVFMT